MNPAAEIVPPGVVTTTLPEEPLATTAVMLVADTTVNEEAGVPPKLTAVAPLKLFPVIVTIAPVAALVGVNEATVGEGRKVKLVADEVVPPGLVTVMTPVAPDPTVTVIVVAVFVVIAASVPPIVTDVAPLKLVPMRVIFAPLAPDVGVKEVIVGSGINVKLAADEPVPPAVVTVITPVAPAPAVTVILVAVFAVMAAAVPPIVTEVAALRLVPLIITLVPLAPDAGVNEVIVGAGTKRNPAEEAVPPGVTTLRLPDAPELTTAVMLVADTTV